MLGKLTVFLLFLLLVWGNVVSGLGAGLACPDWPLCYGQYIPPLKWDIILEKGHRVVAALTGGVLIGLCVQRLLRYRGWSRVLPLTAVFFLAIQILLGREVVLLKLPVNVTTLHFGVAIAILSLALYMAFHDGTENRPRFSLRGISGVLFVLCFLVLVQSVFGAYVRHSGSGLGCGVDFPRCLGFWIPPPYLGLCNDTSYTPFDRIRCPFNCNSAHRFGINQQQPRPHQKYSFCRSRTFAHTSGRRGGCGVHKTARNGRGLSSSYRLINTFGRRLRMV